MIRRTLRRNGALSDFPWQARRVSGRFRNIGDPWVPRFGDLLRWKFGPRPPGVPADAIPLPPRATPDRARIENPDPNDIVVTWIGHSTFLLQAGGFNLLTDPIFSDYCAPWNARNLRRCVPPALIIPELPRIDLILLSHAHYDHCDRPSLLQFDRATPIACPLGLGARLNRWGLTGVVEFGWGDIGELADAKLVCLPVQHGAARTPFDRNTTLWCGWMLEIAQRHIFFAGDTGYARYFPEMLARFAPVNLALLPIGAYEPAWFMQPLHMNPIEAVQVYRDCHARTSIAMHWGTFELTDEPFDEPPRALRKALADAAISESDFRIAAIGETITLATARP